MFSVLYHFQYGCKNNLVPFYGTVEKLEDITVPYMHAIDETGKMHIQTIIPIIKKPG